MSEPEREQAWSRADLPPALQRAIDLAVDKNARGLTVLRVTEIAGYTDWVLICSGRADRQVRAIADAVQQGLSADGVKPLGTDGLQEHLWALLDYDDFLVHVFYHPVRKYYDLESMWSDAPRVDLDLPKDVMDVSDLDRLDAPVVMPQPRSDFRGDIGFGGFDDEFDDDDDDDDDDPPARPVAPDDANDSTSSPSDDDLFES